MTKSNVLASGIAVCLWAFWPGLFPSKEIFNWLAAQKHLRSISIHVPGANSFDEGLDLAPIRVLNRDNLWMVGHFKPQQSSIPGSVLLYSSDGGRSWKSQLTDSSQHFADVNFVNQKSGWICGDDGLILESSDGGTSWQKQPTATKSDLIQLQFTDSQVGWALGEDGEILRTTNGGSSWSAHAIRTAGDIFALSFRDSRNGWVVGEKNQAYESTDGGIHWRSRGEELKNLLGESEKHDAHFRTVKFVTSRVGFIGLYIAPKRAFQGAEDTTAKSYVLKTDDGGTTWRVIFGRTGFVFNSVEFVSSSEVWLILQAEETVLHTKDGGKTWSKVTTLPSFEVTNLYFADSENGWAVEGSGMFTNKVHYTHDGARSWAKSQLPEINKVDR